MDYGVHYGMGDKAAYGADYGAAFEAGDIALNVMDYEAD